MMFNPFVNSRRTELINVKLFISMDLSIPQQYS
jgi:hypothetical protein